MIRIEKHNLESVFSCIHFDGKSKNYYVKRFVFEELAIGKRTGFISEEPGSKMILLSNADHPIIKIEALKGKSQLFDEQELDLSEAIEVKGLKAQGNKLTQHDVQKVTLISEENDEPEEVEEEIEESESDVEETELEEEPETENIVNENQETETKPVVEIEAVEEPKKEVDKKPEFVSKPKEVKKIDFEITNPDEIKLDDKGQLGLF
jgi:topoisomerase-4 subunit A